MEILFPDEVKTLLTNTDPQPASDSNANQNANANTPVPASQLEPQVPLTTTDANAANANGEPKSANRPLQQQQQFAGGDSAASTEHNGVPATQPPAPEPAPPIAPTTQSDSPPVTSNSPQPSPPNSDPASDAAKNVANNANAQPAPAVKKSTPSRFSSYTSNSMLLVSIVVILILHFVVYLFFVHNVVKSNTEQMSKMVTVLEELNVRLRRMNGEPDSDVIDDEPGEETSGENTAQQTEPR